ncbi:MAG TPA: TIGR04282 family arsenosugar biosynthesis glycosyltransferase [Pseudomonadales bacterium]|nr:TIGR04282 family arsenosugar biosynthesis glycosyltransferase [Pseudomonadales bacterium]
MTPVRILVFARDPVPGRVKTRLIPELGAQGACALYLMLLDAVLAEVRGADAQVVELWADRVPASPALPGRSPDLPVRVQEGRDLGARMAHALETTLADGALPILVGSDLPGLTAAHCRQAAACLRAGADAVFAPAEDGGYGLVGLSRPWAGAFDAMPWGGPEVMARTRARAVRDRVDLVALEPVWDVDEPADLPRLDALPRFRDWRRRSTEQA